MPNCEEISEQIRTGRLDFALVKPIDTQFLISLHRVDWSSLVNFVFGLGLLGYSLWRLTTDPVNPLVIEPWQVLLYPLYVACGVTILYSLMIALSATSIWLGRNQSLYDFWFYITNFSRYPMEIYGGNIPGRVLRAAFTFVVPVLVVVNVPARLLAWPMSEQGWALILVGLVATVLSLVLSRWVFVRALASYRSASS
jgi:ABC-2 type transport system permease protein